MVRSSSEDVSQYVPVRGRSHPHKKQPPNRVALPKPILPRVVPYSSSKTAHRARIPDSSQGHRPPSSETSAEASKGGALPNIPPVPAATVWPATNASLATTAA